MTSLRVVEICAGAGGQALGLERAGFTCELAVEINPDAAATLRANRLHWDVRTGDASSNHVWRPRDHWGIDLFAGGVPCQPFTVAGLQRGADDQRDMLGWAISAVGVMRPKAVLLENVRGLSTSRFRPYRDHVLAQLAGWGYDCTWQLLDAQHFGVPQTRTRFVLVAVQRQYAGGYRWPATQEQPCPSVGETLKDLMAANGWEGAENWAIKANGVAPTIVGGSKQHGGPDLGPTRARAAWAALGVDGKGVADDAPGPGWRPAPDRAGPKLTTGMVARIQGWNDSDWVFTGRKTSRYQQIGNAFPPPVAEALGRSIARALGASDEQ